jgi:hypothetical protein
MSRHLIDLPAAERDEFSFRPLVSKHRITISISSATTS